MDGPGAIVLSPTRELAVQIFNVLRQVGAYHSFRAGLLVGGRKEFLQEQQHVGRTNIIIATPGRLLQHLEQTHAFDPSQLQVLVLDEADRILDMGFRSQMERILDYLPSNDRQTMLFSATQTRKVSDLAALSLHRPEYLGVHDKEKSTTPESLQQSVVVVPLEHKLNAVYSFIKTHLKHKIIVFLATCSQVRHAWELFCQLQPGLPVMALHGKLVQEKRTKIYQNFLQKPHAVLFATDVAARGLDIPNIDWVVQADAPEDKDMYIHRAGRTARYKANGKAMLMVTPSEEDGMIKLLRQARIPLQRLSINPSKTVLVTQRAAALVASRPKLQRLAKKAFQSYLRSVHLMPHRDVFDVQKLDVDAYAAALGLAATPALKFLRYTTDREGLREKKNVNHKLNKLKEHIKAEKLAKKLAKLEKKQKQTASDGNVVADAGTTETKKRSRSNNDDDDDDDDAIGGGLLVVKRKVRPEDVVTANDKEDESDLPDVNIHAVTRARSSKKIRINGSNSTQNKRIVFGDDGEEIADDRELESNNNTNKYDGSSSDGLGMPSREELAEANEGYMRRVRERLESTRQQDADEAKQRIRDKHRKKRMQEKPDLDESNGAAGDGHAMAVLGSATSNSDDSSSDDDDSTDSSSDDSDEEKSGGDIRNQEELALAMIRGS